MSHRHVEQLEPVRQEHDAARTALFHLERSWHDLAGHPDTRGVRLSHVQEAARNLEATYIIRLFSEFEGLLQDYLAVRHPRRRIPRTAEALINRVALGDHIPDPIRDAAHRVREYRNSLVHRRAAAAPTLSIQQTMAALNRFLALLLDRP